MWLVKQGILIKMSLFGMSVPSDVLSLFKCSFVMFLIYWDFLCRVNC
jgi:hypothetical protein